MKKLLTALLILMFAIPDKGLAQELKGCILKTIDDLIILDIGSKAGLKKNSKFDVIKNTELDLPAAKITVNQLEQNLAVCKILMKKENIPLNEGDQVLLFSSISDEKIQIPSLFQKQKPEKSLIIKPFHWKTNKIRKFLQGKRKHPLSIILSYTYGYKNIAKAISENISMYILSTIYNGEGTSKISVSKGSGWNLAVRKILSDKLSAGLNYTRCTINSHIKTQNKLPSDEVEPLPGTIASWDFDLNTNVNSFSASLLFGNFHKITDYFFSYVREYSFVYHIGIGINYMNITGSNNQIITKKTEFYKDYESFNKVDNFKKTGYWGGNLSIGVSFFIPSFRIFVETSFIKWGKKEFKKNFPFRTGFEIFF
ncbi:hypothetical protein DRQ09_08290 [candidate division KSB1 bacterium]|nr:MAG: hypothetical protein DRQ09_08290 [candidate division KSB1 bacterium]